MNTKIHNLFSVKVLSLITFFLLYGYYSTLKHPNDTRSSFFLKGLVVHKKFLKNYDLITIKSKDGKFKVLVEKDACSIGDEFSGVVVNLKSSSLFYAVKTYCSFSDDLSFLLKIKRHLYETFGKLKEGGLLLAIVLGEKSGISSEELYKLKSAGLYHFLAVSGFHLGIFFVIVYLIFKKLWFLFDRHGRVPSLIPASILGAISSSFYAILSGLSAPSLRALIMIWLYTISKVIYRKTDGLDILALTVLIYLIFRPASVLDVSFQLSICAVLGIILFYRSFSKYSFSNKILDKLFKVFVVSCGASFLTFPIALFNFGSFSLFSPVNTVLTLPIWSFVLIPGEIVTAIFSFLSEDFSLSLCKLLYKVFRLMLSFPLLEIFVKPFYFSGIFSVTLISLVAVFLSFVSKKKLLTFAFCFIFVISVLFGVVSENIHFALLKDMDVCSVLFVQYDKHLLLFPIEISRSYEFCSIKTYEMVNKLGYDKIDFLFLNRERENFLYYLKEKIPISFWFSSRYFEGQDELFVPGGKVYFSHGTVSLRIEELTLTYFASLQAFKRFLNSSGNLEPEVLVLPKRVKKEGRVKARVVVRRGESGVIFLKDGAFLWCRLPEDLLNAMTWPYDAYWFGRRCERHELRSLRNL